MIRPAYMIGLALVAGGCVLPFVTEGYTIYSMTRLLALAIAIAGVNLLTGVAGLFSIGQSAFFALGAYAVGIGGQQLGLSPYLCLPLAALWGGLLGFGFGWPAARLSAVHLALLTWGLAISLPRVLKSTWLEDWTGGVQGLYLERPGAPVWTGLTDDQWWWFVTLAITLAVFVMLDNVLRSRWGRAFRAARDQPLAASSMGVHVGYYRALAFAVSGAVTAVAGAITGLLDDFVAPDAYSVFFSITLLVGAVAGGIHSLAGALVGAVMLAVLSSLSQGLSQYIAFPIYGFVLIGLIMLAPRGVTPQFERLLRWLSGRLTQGRRG
ncbi:MAG: branched-chain amino acid ABC transporter permease [Minwuia sp.]|uniref:branched-chain amino acid ABC transporter permease n=1 Tax=Minwuia sp. TaxID=2493630 RepID=UPI003A89C784